MKPLLGIIILFFPFTESCVFNQNLPPLEILNKTVQNINEIKNGYYDVSIKYKYLLTNDTSKLNASCTFELPTRFGVTDKKYKIKFFHNRTEKIYNDSVFYGINHNDSTANILHDYQRASTLKGSIETYLLYELIFNEKNILTEIAKDTNEYAISFNKIKDKNINALKIQVNSLKAEEIQNAQMTIFIDMDSFFPYKFIEKITFRDDVQYKEIEISNYHFNSNNFKIGFNKDSIPQIYQIQYNP
ncbi:MAG TPA: hypothetical protein VJY62_11580 [Bacteroidia bacterium]|nr:hypothetical protein [Bacteroidia bacterium]